MSTECSTIRNPNAVIQGMARHPNIFAIIFAVIVSIIANYGDSFSSKPVEVPPKQPTFWYSPHQSVVLDSPRGSLLPIANRLRRDELVFVMFYAPWCARSVEAKVEFEKAAVILQGKVTFAAVNCWWPEGECNKQYKFLVYPAFLAYHTTLDAFKFVGVTRADHMVKFMESLLHPVSLVNSLHQVQELIARYDYVVFGYFDLMADAQIGAYRQFYYASMRMLEKDPFQPIHFAVVCSQSIAHKVHLNQYQDILMAGIGRNTTIFPHKNNITSTNLVTWALKEKRMPPVKRLSPLGMKSRFVSSEINKGPALIMFHPENVLFRAEPAMRVMKDVALQYKSCYLSREYKGLNLIWKKVVQDDLRLYEEVVEKCRLFRKSQLLIRNFPCCMSTVVKPLKGNTLICDICKASNGLSCMMSNDIVASTLSQTPLVGNCHSTVLSYHDKVDFDVCCHNGSRYAFNVTEWVDYDKGFTRPSHSVYNSTTASDSEARSKRRLTDRFYLDHLENLPRRLCSRLTVQKRDVGTVDEPESDVAKPSLMKRFRELSCGFNGTLNFYSVDSKSHWMFSERLGLSLDPLSSSGVVIFDKDNEEHYIMKENLTVSNTMSFILDYQQGNLKRHVNTHSFRAPGCGKNSDSICVRELDSNNFLDVVKDENKDVVVLIYAHWCGFCQTLSHTFLSVARYFSTSKYISFVRINGDTNDLPWEYTVEVFPTILFFPAHRKADSIMFPPWKEKSRTNLIRFILRHTTFDTRLLLAADVCANSCIRVNLHRSTALMRELKGRYMRSHVKLKNIMKHLSGESNKDYYFRLSYEYLRKHLVELNDRMKNVKKLIEYLRSSENGVIYQQELMELFRH